MNTRVVIFGNGTLSESFLKQLKPADYIIGVDRAAYWLLTHHIIPQVAIGDFDSVTKNELNRIKKTIQTLKIFPRKKNWTDMELAVNYARTLAAKEVIIYGATGGRLDHMLATLYLRGTYTLIDDHNRIRRVGRGKTILKKASYRYVSILPYTKSITVSLSGFRYNVERKMLQQGTTMGVSNEISGARGVVTLHSGSAWVIESND